MAVPYNPEPDQLLKDRFSVALKKAWNVAETLKDSDNRPGSQPENVFDFEDGIRLIISRDYYKEKQVLHFSSSIIPDICKYPVDESLLKVMEGKFFLLYGMEVPLQFIGITAGAGIPHWVCEFQNLN